MTEPEKQLLRNVQTHDLAEMLRQRRARLAREAGLPPENFALPFPGHHSVTIHRTEGGSSGGLLPALVLAGLLAGAAVGLCRLWPAARPAPPQVEPIEVEIEVWNENGQWKWKARPVQPGEEQPRMKHG